MARYGRSALMRLKYSSTIRRSSGESPRRSAHDGGWNLDAAFVLTAPGGVKSSFPVAALASRFAIDKC